MRKNLERILAAAAHAQRIDARHPLVVVGGTAHSGVSTELSPDIRRSIDEGRIVMLGGVDDDELAWLYANAALAITLSLDEGFGMPAVEAALFGAPLLVSDIDVFRETVGDYARFVDPVAPIEGIAHAIDDAWGTTPDAAARRRIVATYTWENAVRAVRAAIATAL